MWNCCIQADIIVNEVDVNIVESGINIGIIENNIEVQTREDEIIVEMLEQEIMVEMDVCWNISLTGARIEEFEITPWRLAVKTITLNAEPNNNRAEVTIQHAPWQFRWIDYEVSWNNIIRWWLWLDGELGLGDLVTITY